MYSYCVQVFRNESGEITGGKCLSRSRTPIGRRGLETISIEMEEEVAPDFVKVELVEGQLVISEDTEKIAQEADIKIRIKRIEFGQRLVAIMSIRNDAKSLTTQQIVDLVAAFSSINTAWLNGSIATSRALVDAITPDGTLITTDDKTAILAEIDANLAALGYE